MHLLFFADIAQLAVNGLQASFFFQVFDGFVQAALVYIRDEQGACALFGGAFGRCVAYAHASGGGHEYGFAFEQAVAGNIVWCWLHIHILQRFKLSKR